MSAAAPAPHDAAPVGVPADPGRRARDAWHRRAGRTLAVWAVRGLAAGARVLPWRLGCALGEGMGLLAWAFAVSQRRLAKAQLALAMGAELGGTRGVARVVRRLFCHFGRMAVETLMLPRLEAADLRALVVNDGEASAILRDLRQEGDGSHRGVLVITPHFGNWELLGAWLASHFPTSVVAKRIYDERFDRVVAGWRADLGMKTILAESSPRRILRALREGDVVGMLPDQDMSRVAGVFVTFFGRPAWTPTAPALIAAMEGAPMVPTFIVREGARFRIVLEEPVPLQSTDDRDADALANTAAWSARVEAMIRSYPEQWAWLHKRWKTTPEKMAGRGGSGEPAKPPRSRFG